MYDYFGNGIHTILVLKHLNAKILKDGDLWSNLCQFRGPLHEKV